MRRVNGDGTSRAEEGLLGVGHRHARLQPAAVCSARRQRSVRAPRWDARGRGSCGGGGERRSSGRWRAPSGSSAVAGVGASPAATCSAVSREISPGKRWTTQGKLRGKRPKKARTKVTSSRRKKMSASPAAGRSWPLPVVALYQSTTPDARGGSASTAVGTVPCVITRNRHGPEARAAAFESEARAAHRSADAATAVAASELLKQLAAAPRGP